jgi:hypothetical protein
MHNYMNVILDKQASGELPIMPGQVYDIYCLHDPWCKMNDDPPGECNCNVSVEIVYRPKAGDKAPHTEDNPTRKRHGSNKESLITG